MHRYSVDQNSVGLYWQQTVAVLPTTDFSYGARVQQTAVSARDVFDAMAPGGVRGTSKAMPLDKTDAQHALHAGIEHRFNDVFTVFGRLARSFRTPNVDERVGQGFPTNFDLKTQTSHDAEAGFRVTWGRMTVAVERLCDGSHQRDHVQSGYVLQHQPRSDPAATASRPRRPTACPTRSA